MSVRIKYCVPCGYRRRAERLAELIGARLNEPVELEKGNFGVFKVWRGERLVFDKRNTRGWLGKVGFGKLPLDSEILQMLESATT